jgi:hypothetical protein
MLKSIDGRCESELAPHPFAFIVDNDEIICRVLGIVRRFLSLSQPGAAHSLRESPRIVEPPRPDGVPFLSCVIALAFRQLGRAMTDRLLSAVVA